MSAEEAKKNVSDISIALMRKRPLFGFLLKGMNIIFVNEDREDFGNGVTAHIKTDGDRIYIYRDFLKVDGKDQAYDILHELMHVVLKHNIRGVELIRKVSEKIGATAAMVVNVPMVVNIAMDAKVYRYMSNDGFYRKAGGIPYSLFSIFPSDELEKSSVEELVLKYFDKIDKMVNMAKYDFAGDMLPNLEPTHVEGGEADGEGEVDGEEKQEKGDGTPKEVVIQEAEKIYADKTLEEKIDKMVADAIVKARIAGVGGGKLENMIEGIYLSRRKIEWNRILGEELRSLALRYKINDWRKINRKLPFMIAGKSDVTLPKVYACIDVSGSIDDEDYKKFCAEVLKISKITSTTAIFWDDGINKIVKVRRASDLSKRVGYGGTVFMPVIRRLSREVKAGDAVVVLTDCWWYDDRDASESLDKLKCRKILVTVSKVVGKWDRVIEVKD